MSHDISLVFYLGTVSFETNQVLLEKINLKVVFILNTVLKLTIICILIHDGHAYVNIYRMFLKQMRPLAFVYSVV